MQLDFGHHLHIEYTGFVCDVNEKFHERKDNLNVYNNCNHIFL